MCNFFSKTFLRAPETCDFKGGGGGGGAFLEKAENARFLIKFSSSWYSDFDKKMQMNTDMFRIER